LKFQTTVARLFSKILQDAGVRTESSFIETTAQQCKDGGMDDFRKNINSAMGGVLFIDEAYELDPIGDFKGKPVVNELLVSNVFHLLLFALFFCKLHWILIILLFHE
jgi:hypothetical protein